MTRPIAHYPASSPADRARETEQVIANVRADIPPAEQAQALRDLKAGADGEPQLDEGMLERAAEESEHLAREPWTIIGGSDVQGIDGLVHSIDPDELVMVLSAPSKAAWEALDVETPVRLVPATARDLDAGTAEVTMLRAKVRLLRGVELHAAKHAVACGTVIAALMRRLGIDAATIEGAELATIDHAVDLDVERGPGGDYARLRVRVEPREREDG